MKIVSVLLALFSVLAIVSAGTDEANRSLCMCSCPENKVGGSCEAFDAGSNSASCPADVCDADGCNMLGHGKIEEVFLTDNAESCQLYLTNAISANFTASEREVFLTKVMANVIRTVIPTNSTRTAETPVKILSSDLLTETKTDHVMRPMMCPAWKEITSKGCTGKCLRECIDSFIIEKGESVLEGALCVVLAGPESPFCKKVLPMLMEPINHYINQKLEKIVIEKVDKTEQKVAKAVVKASKKFGHWVKNLFIHHHH